MGIMDKAKELLDKTDIDEKIVAKAGELKEKVKDAKLDEKAKAGFEAAKTKVRETLDKTDLDEKVAAKAKEIKDKIEDKLD